MAETELDIHDSERHIDELERLAGEDLSARLRVGLGRQMIAAARGSFEGIWRIISPLTALAAHADDPMAQTTLWANAAYLCTVRTEYSRAARLSRRALDACDSFRLEFARGYCIGYLAGAELGQRQFRMARQHLKHLAALAEAQDNSYMRVMHAVTSVRLALTQSSPRDALRVVPMLEDSRIPKASRGEMLSVLALAHAAAGNYKAAADLSAEARTTTRAVETVFYTDAAELIGSIRDGSHEENRARAADFLQRAQQADFMDVVVVAYRAHPPLLALLAEGSRSLGVMKIVRRARDERLASQLGLDVGAVDTRQAGLTRRETDVLALLGEGLTNAQIATRLVITESTVKVHVHHIFEKLGVKTRLQAVLAAQEYGA